MRKLFYCILLTSGICLVSSCSKYFFVDSDAVYRVDARENVREFIWKLKAATKGATKVDVQTSQDPVSEKVNFEVDSISK